MKQKYSTFDLKAQNCNEDPCPTLFSNLGGSHKVVSESDISKKEFLTLMVSSSDQLFEKGL